MDSIESPPQYDDNFPTRSRNVRVEPREDEGKEALPAYSTAISLMNTLQRKMEYENAAQRASNRNWHKVKVSLQGTALKLYKPQKCFRFKSAAGRDPVSLPLIKSYNLHHAQVGVATDYAKKKHVIRIRVETQQFLLSCDKIEVLVNWMQSLGAAIDLATPLDDRDYPEDFCLPRRQRRVRSSPCSVRAGDQTRVPTSPNFHPRARSQSISNPRSRSTVRSCIISHDDSSPLNFSIYSSSRSSLSSSCSHAGAISNISQDNKWRPCHQWSPSYDMIYAKRCLAVLTSCMPRKSNIVIMNGEFYVVDWVTGYMTRLRDVTPSLQRIDHVADSINTKYDVETPVELPPEYRDLGKTKL